MDRFLTDFIRKDMDKKIILLSGPRQAGKTTLSKSLVEDFDYFTYDDVAHRLLLKERNWDRRKPLVIFDELHKMPSWKTWLKAIYDVEGLPPSIVVTGSAHLDAFREMGDSLAGRFFSYRLHPFDVKEVAHAMEPSEALRRIMTVGGFPEPFLENDATFYARWKKTHLDVIVRQDMLDLTAISDIKSIETLIELLRARVGSPVSYTNLGNDLQKDAKTVKSWLQLLEDLYVVFPVRPWHDNIARAILKEPKYYFFDTGQVKGNEGARLENAVACSLRKNLEFLEDTRGVAVALHYLRTKDNKELDFAIAIDGLITHAMEVKLSDSNRSPAFDSFAPALKDARKIQLVANIDREKTWPDGLLVTDAASYLAEMDLISTEPSDNRSHRAARR